MKRHVPLRHHTPIRRVSAKQRRKLRRRGRCREQVARRADDACEIRIPGVCKYVGGHVHEPLTRARGGSIVDPSNAKLACAACHAWVHEHPKAATVRGLLLTQFQGGSR